MTQQYAVRAVVDTRDKKVRVQPQGCTFDDFLSHAECVNISKQATQVCLSFHLQTRVHKLKSTSVVFFHAT